MASWTGDGYDVSYWAMRLKNSDKDFLYRWHLSTDLLGGSSYAEDLIDEESYQEELKNAITSSTETSSWDGIFHLAEQDAGGNDTMVDIAANADFKWLLNNGFRFEVYGEAPFRKIGAFHDNSQCEISEIRIAYPNNLADDHETGYVLSKDEVESMLLLGINCTADSEDEGLGINLEEVVSIMGDTEDYVSLHSSLNATNHSFYLGYEFDDYYLVITAPRLRGYIYYMAVLKDKRTTEVYNRIFRK